jgi:hypothetical protein
MNSYMLRIIVVTLFAITLAATQAMAQKRYDPGATDTEIKIGNIMPYTGPFSEYGAIGRAMAAYVQMINDRGGVNGRKIMFVSVDDGADPEKTVQQARKLVEQDEVLLIVGSWGSVTNKAIRPYMNEKKVPQLFVGSTDSTFDDSSNFPWTMGFQASKRTEGLAYAKYIMDNNPGAKIAVLYSHDEDGTEYRLAIHDGLGAKADRHVEEFWGRYLHQPGGRKICNAGDTQGLRCRLAPDAVHSQRLPLDRCFPRSRGSCESCWNHLERAFQGLDQSAVETRSRRTRVSRMDAEIQPEGERS